MGCYTICLPVDHSLILDPCYVISSCNKNIISVSSLGTEGYSFSFGNNTCFIYLNEGLYAERELSNGFYVLILSKPVMFINYKRRKFYDSYKHYSSTIDLAI